jgi:hypothetical protein
VLSARALLRIYNEDNWDNKVGSVRASAENNQCSDDSRVVKGRPGDWCEMAAWLGASQLKHLRQLEGNSRSERT